MSLLSSMPFRVLLLGTFFLVLIGGFSWYTTVLQYRRDTAHLQFVDPNNELWAQAKKLSVATIDTFILLYPQYPQQAFVKFAKDGTSGQREDIWAKVTAIGPGFVGISIEPAFLKEAESPQRELPLGQVIDWMIELPNGNIRGGYTTQALLKLQQQQPDAPDSLATSLEKFEDRL